MPRGMTETRSPLGRPVGADGERTRARIISAAMRSVAEVGAAQATIREIARAADMTSGSLYHYFSNKSELLNATVAEMEQIALPRLRVAAAQADGVVDRLAAVLDEFHRLTREFPHLAAFDRAIRAESDARAHGGRPPYPGLKALRDIIAEIIGDGPPPNGGNPGAAVDAIYALTRGLTERAATLGPDAYAATLDSAKELIRGTLFARRASRPASTGRRRSARDL